MREREQADSNVAAATAVRKREVQTRDRHALCTRTDASRCAACRLRTLSPRNAA